MSSADAYRRAPPFWLTAARTMAGSFFSTADAYCRARSSFLKAATTVGGPFLDFRRRVTQGRPPVLAGGGEGVGDFDGSILQCFCRPLRHCSKYIFMNRDLISKLKGGATGRFLVRILW